MAQMVVKGFVAGVNKEEIGDNKTKKVTLSFVDDTHRKTVFFPIGCWGKLADVAENFSKGQRLYCNVTAEDGSYNKTDENGEEIKDKDGKPVRILAYNYTLADYVEDPRIEADLFAEFNALKNASENNQENVVPKTDAPAPKPELTPVDEQIPFN